MAEETEEYEYEVTVRFTKDGVRVGHLDDVYVYAKSIADAEEKIYEQYLYNHYDLGVDYDGVEPCVQLDYGHAREEAEQIYGVKYDH